MGRLGVITSNIQRLSFILIGCIFYAMEYFDHRKRSPEHSRVDRRKRSVNDLRLGSVELQFKRKLTCNASYLPLLII